MNTLTYEEALEIYNEMERLVDRTDEDILYLYNSLIERAIRYAHTRSEWTTLTRQERIDKDESRSILHECCTSLLLFRHILGGQTDMIYKRCPRCNKRIEAGTTCEGSKLRHREYDRLSRDKESANFYHSSNWQRMREYIMNKYDNLDVYAYVLYGQIEKAETVHHIVELDVIPTFHKKNSFHCRSAAESGLFVNHNRISFLDTGKTVRYYEYGFFLR